MTSLGPAVLRRLGAAVKTGARGVAFELRSMLTQLAADDPMLRGDRSAVDLLAGATLTALGGRAELFGGASVARDGAVPRAALAYTRMLAPRAQARFEATVNDLAPESAVLLAEAVRTRAGGSLALGSARFFARAAGEWKTWSSRAGTWLGRGGAGTLEVGVHARIADPEINVRLHAGTQRNEVATPMPDAPLLPDELTTLGVGVTVARWNVGPARLLLDTWLGQMTPPRRLAYRLQSGIAIAPFAATELSLVGYVANDNWMIGRGCGCGSSRGWVGSPTPRRIGSSRSTRAAGDARSRTAPIRAAPASSPTASTFAASRPSARHAPPRRPRCSGSWVGWCRSRT